MARDSSLAVMDRIAREMIRTEPDPAKAARAVRDSCLELAQLEPPSPSPADPPGPTTLTWGGIQGSMQVEGLEEPWLEGERRTLRVRLRNEGRVRWLAGDRGKGGIVLELRLLAQGRDHLQSRPWPGLPVDLDRGSEATLELELRRPLGECTLRIEPHVLGNAGFSALGGPTFEDRV